MLTASQCATYDETKKLFKRLTGAGDNFGTHLASSLLTGLVTTTATAPVDVIKTHMFMGELLCSTVQPAPQQSSLWCWGRRVPTPLWPHPCGSLLALALAFARGPCAR